MALITPVQRSFNSGLWSKSLYGRWDLNSYEYALSKCTNFIPQVSGNLKKRTGTIFAGNAATQNTGNCQLVPFVYSKTDSMVLEVFYDSNASSGKMRFWTVEENKTSTDGSSTGSNKITFATPHKFVTGDGPSRFGKIGSITLDGVSAELKNSAKNVFIRVLNTTEITFHPTVADATNNTNILPIAGSVSAETFQVSTGGLGYPVTTTVGADGATDGNRYEISLPYLDDEIRDIDFAQKNDVFIVTHQNHPPKKLSRFANNNWEFETLNFRYGPYLGIGQVEPEKDLHRDNYNPNSPYAGKTGNASLIAIKSPEMYLGRETSFDLLRQAYSGSAGTWSWDQCPTLRWMESAKKHLSQGRTSWGVAVVRGSFLDLNRNQSNLKTSTYKLGTGWHLHFVDGSTQRDLVNDEWHYNAWSTEHDNSQMDASASADPDFGIFRPQGTGGEEITLDRASFPSRLREGQWLIIASRSKYEIYEDNTESREWPFFPDGYIRMVGGQNPGWYVIEDILVPNHKGTHGPNTHTASRRIPSWGNGPIFIIVVSSLHNRNHVLYSLEGENPQLNSRDDGPRQYAAPNFYPSPSRDTTGATYGGSTWSDTPASFVSYTPAAGDIGGHTPPTVPTNAPLNRVGEVTTDSLYLEQWANVNTQVLYPSGEIWSQVIYPKTDASLLGDVGGEPSTDHITNNPISRRLGNVVFDASEKSVTRSTGSFITDGYNAYTNLKIAGSPLNTGTGYYIHYAKVTHTASTTSDLPEYSSGNLTITTTGSNNVITRTTGDWTTANENFTTARAGAKIRLSGSATSGNNIETTIVSATSGAGGSLTVATNALTVSGSPEAAAFAVEFLGLEATKIWFQTSDTIADETLNEPHWVSMEAPNHFLGTGVSSGGADVGTATALEDPAIDPFVGHIKPFHAHRDVGRNVLVNCHNANLQDPSLTNLGDTRIAANSGKPDPEIQDMTDSQFAFPMWGEIIAVAKYPPAILSDIDGAIDSLPVQQEASIQDAWGEGVVISWNNGRLLGYDDIFKDSVGDNTGIQPLYLNTANWYMSAFYEGPRSTLANMSLPSPEIKKEYPRSCSFFKNRLWFAATPGSPSSIWASRSGTLDDFDLFSASDSPPSVPPAEIGPFTGGRGTYNADDTVNSKGTRAVQALQPNIQSTQLATSSIAITISGGMSGDVLWIRPLGDSLFAGTTDAIHRVYVENPTEGFGPTDPISADIVNATGSGSRHVFQSRDRIIFTDPGNQRVFKIGYKFANDSYSSEDLTIFNKDLLSSGVIDSTMQMNPQETLWLSTSDGRLMSLVLDEEQKVYAWSEHSLSTGNVYDSSKVDALTAIPDITDPSDQVWALVSRTKSDGTVHRHVEYTSPELKTSDNAEDQIFMDSAVTYPISSGNVIPAAIHLANQNVAVIVDGVLRANVTLDGSGTASFAGAAGTSKITYGIPYTAEAATMPVVVTDPQGSSFTKRTNASHMTAMVRYSGNFEIGAGPENVSEWRKPTDDKVDASFHEDRFQVPIPSIPSRELVFGIRSTEARNLEVTALGGFVDAASR